MTNDSQDNETGGRPGQPGQQVPGDTAQYWLRADRSPGARRVAADVLAEIRRPARRDRDRLPPRPAPETRDVHEPQWTLGRPGDSVLQTGPHRPLGRLRRSQLAPR